ncbi:MAG: hypothetical protein ACOYD0_00060 [Candidatus Nanopelagicales bacterium]
MRLSDAAERAQLLGGLTRNQASRQLLRIEAVAGLYFGLMELRSPAKAKAARRAMKNQKVNEFYWQWRDRKVRGSRPRRLRTTILQSRRTRSRQSIGGPPAGKPTDGYADHWLDSP